MKSFEKGFENDFEKWSIFTRSFEKYLTFESLKEIQGETVFGLSSNLIDHGKRVCKFIERFLKMILKSEGYSQEVFEKNRFKFENWKENIFEKY